MTDLEKAPAATQLLTAPDARTHFAAIVNRLAREVTDHPASQLPRGDVAALRREDGTRSPTFYKLAALVLDDELGRYAGEELLSEAESRWARVVHLLARTAGQHRPGAPHLGVALGKVQLAEGRFLRLVRAEGTALDAAARAALAPLAQKAVPFNPRDLAALVLSTPHPHVSFYRVENGEQVRRRLARDFYRSAPRSQEASQ